MLAGQQTFGERGRSGMACAWWRGRLWVAYEGQSQTLVVRSMDVLHAGATTRVDTGLVCGGIGAVVSMAVDGGRLHVAFGEDGVDYRRTSSATGSSWSAPDPLPPGAAFLGSRSLVSTPQGLSLLWAEDAGGQGHLLDVASGSDVALPFRVGGGPGACWDPTTGRLVLAYGDRADAATWHLQLVDPADPGSPLAQADFSLASHLQSVSLCATRYHQDPGLHVALYGGSGGGAQARTCSGDLSVVGGEEPLGPRPLALDLAFDGRRTWAAWLADDGEVLVAPYGDVFDLPEELRARLGQECDPGQCPVDPRLVCAASDEVRWLWEQPRIRNARKGDLVMTPGDGTGLIGTLLEQLDPRQYFDHMGIVLRDEVLVRHATMAHDRLNRKKPGRMMTGEIFGMKAPVDGFRPDALGQGWPGTITQSVDDAFFTGFNTVDPATGRPYNAQGDFSALNPGVARLPRPADGAPAAEWDAWRLQQQFADPEFPADETYPIHNFPVGPAYRLESGTTIDPVVVKPSEEGEALDPRIRDVLHRVADTAATVRGHYRFYAYSDARIALDPALLGTPGTWAEGTRPLVCSSFVWAAVQLASAAGRPRLEVEGRVTESPDELLATPTVDGLYRYLTSEREKAGTALHALVEDKVRTEVYLALQEAVHDGGVLVDVARVGLAALLGYLTGPIGAALAILGTSESTIADLSLALFDMPDDVAAQLCNAFAKDRPDDHDDDLWATPGEGLAVSPDDIKAFWDPPDGDGNAEFWHGLYGTSQKMLLTYGRQEPKTVHRLERSAGPAYVEGQVLYRGQPVAGARVRFGCEEAMTRRVRDSATYELEIAAGRYEVVATAYWPATQELLRGTRVVDVQAGDQPGAVDLELEDPPEWRRLVRVTGRIDVVRRVYFGSDDWAHSAINLQGPLTWAPSDWGQPPDGASALTWTPSTASGYAQRFNMRVDLTVTLQEDLSVVVVARSALCEHWYDTGKPPAGDQVVTSTQHDPVTIGPGGSSTFTFDHNSGNAPPDRGHVEFTAVNERMPA